MVKKFSQGDIILLNFDPQTGHEQKGTRPAIVVSNDIFNGFTKMAIVCPITSTDRNNPIQIRLDERTKTQGIIMCDQVKSLDLYRRNAKFLEKAPPDIIFQVVDMVYSFIEI
jgi:mRNA interferase MazF